MEQHCSKCDSTWVSNELVGCPTCQGKKMVQLSGKLVMVDPKDYHFGTVTQRPMTKWERFLDWLADIVEFKFLKRIF